MRFAITFIVLILAAAADGETQPPSMWLLSVEATLAEHCRMLDAAAIEVSRAGFDPAEFRARILCSARDICEVNVFPEKLETGEYSGYRGCPIKFCATMTWSNVKRAFTEISHWS